MIEAHSLNHRRFALAKEYGAGKLAHCLRLNQGRNHFHSYDPARARKVLLGVKPNSERVARKPLKLGDMRDKTIVEPNRLDQIVHQLVGTSHSFFSLHCADAHDANIVARAWQVKGSTRRCDKSSHLPAVSPNGNHLEQKIANRRRARFAQHDFHAVELDNYFPIPDFSFCNRLTTEGLHMSLRQYDMLCVLGLCAAAISAAPWSVIAASCLYLLALIVCAEANRKFLVSQNASPSELRGGPVRTGERGGT